MKKTKCIEFDFNEPVKNVFDKILKESKADTVRIISERISYPEIRTSGRVSGRGVKRSEIRRKYTVCFEYD